MRKSKFAFLLFSLCALLLVPGIVLGQRIISSHSSAQEGQKKADTRIYYDYTRFKSPENSQFDPQKQLYVLKDTNQLRLTWKAYPTRSSTLAQPLQVTLYAKILGPFLSLAELQNVDPATAPVISQTEPISIKNVENHIYNKKIALSSNLKQGYYVLLQSITLKGEKDTSVGESNIPLEIKS